MADALTVIASLVSTPTLAYVECFDPNTMDGSFELPSIEDGVRSLVGPDEIVIGSWTQRRVMLGAKLVGYIQICDASPYTSFNHSLGKQAADRFLPLRPRNARRSVVRQLLCRAR
jgi:hypothetical protein